MTTYAAEHRIDQYGYHTIVSYKNHTVDARILREQFDEHWQEGLGGRKHVALCDYTDETTSHVRALGDKYADNCLFGRLNIDERDHQDYLATERAAAFIRSRTSGDAPFFLNLNFDVTHTPCGIMEPYYLRYIHKQLRLFRHHAGTGKPVFCRT